MYEYCNNLFTVESKNKGELEAIAKRFQNFDSICPIPEEFYTNGNHLELSTEDKINKGFYVNQSSLIAYLLLDACGDESGRKYENRDIFTVEDLLELETITDTPSFRYGYIPNFYSHSESVDQSLKARRLMTIMESLKIINRLVNIDIFLNSSIMDIKDAINGKRQEFESYFNFKQVEKALELHRKYRCLDLYDWIIRNWGLIENSAEDELERESKNYQSLALKADRVPSYQHASELTNKINYLLHAYRSIQCYLFTKIVKNPYKDVYELAVTMVSYLTPPREIYRKLIDVYPSLEMGIYYFETGYHYGGYLRRTEPGKEPFGCHSKSMEVAISIATMEFGYKIDTIKEVVGAEVIEKFIEFRDNVQVISAMIK